MKALSLTATLKHCPLTKLDWLASYTSQRQLLDIDIPIPFIFDIICKKALTRGEPSGNHVTFQSS